MKLIRRGREYVGLCPFHNEKSPSFSVIEDKKFFHCFGCGKSGRAIDWLTEKRGLSFKEGLDFLSQLSGVPLPTLRKTTPADQQRENRVTAVYPLIMAAITHYYHDHLRGPAGKKAYDYLRDRGLTDSTIKQFMLGFSPDEFDPKNLLAHLQNTLAQHGVTEQDLINLGIVRSASDDPKKKFLLFRGRIMFPITNRAGTVIAFGGRFMGDAAAHNTGKYINSPDSTIFLKGNNLYNFKNAFQAVKNKQPLLVVEGYMDVIALAQAGFSSAVAPLGTALTEQQLTLMWQMAKTPIIAFDGDNAGAMAAFRAARRALPHLAAEKTLEFVFMPNGQDPDSLVASSGLAGFNNVLAKKIPLHEFLWQWELARADLSRPEGVLAFEQSLLTHGRNIANPALAKIYQDTFREKIYQEKKNRRAQTNKPTGRVAPRATGGGYQAYANGRMGGRMAKKNTGTAIMTSDISLPLASFYYTDESPYRKPAFLILITLYPHLYNEWVENDMETSFYRGLNDKNNVKLINKHLDNYLKKLHIILRTLPEENRPNYQEQIPEDALNQWQRLLKKQFASDNSDSLWHEVFDKDWSKVYPEIFRGHEGDASNLMKELTQLETIDKLQKDFQQQAIDDNDPTNKKINSFQDEIQQTEQSLHLQSLNNTRPKQS